LRNLGFEVAFTGESEKIDKYIIEGNIKASSESLVRDIKFKEMFSQLHYRRNVVAIVCDEVHIQYCAKVMQTYFAEICDFSWLFDEKIANSRWKRIFNEKSR